VARDRLGHSPRSAMPLNHAMADTMTERHRSIGEICVMQARFLQS